MANECSVCGKKIGGLLSFSRVRESDKEGVCVNCREEQLEKKDKKKQKRKKEKLRKAWLHAKR